MEDNIVMMSILPKATYKLNSRPIKIPKLFPEIEKPVLVVYIYNRILVSFRKKENSAFCDNIDETRGQILHNSINMRYLKQ